MKLTTQQAAFVAEVVTGSRNVCLQARAGTGKTSTILSAVDAVVAARPSAEIAVVVFGKKIQREIETKLRARGHTDWRRVSASTSHSLGWSLCKFFLRLDETAIDDSKVMKLIRARNDAVYGEYGAQIAHLVALAKQDGFGFFPDAQIGDVGAWYRLADHYGVNGFEDTSDMDRVVEAAISIYRESLQITTTVDYSDMVLFPLVRNLRTKFGKDLIFVDEAQDTSRARRALVKKFLKPNGKLVVVGDDRQAIMGFAGASADALAEYIDDVNAVVLPLNVTWRCPKAVVAEAQRYVPDLQAADGAIEGEVLHLDALPAMQPTDAVLCRNTAPLIAQAYALLRAGVACKVEGRDIGSGLVKLLTRWTSLKTITAFVDRLEEYRAREVQKAQAKDRPAKVEEVNDRCDTLVQLCDAVHQRGGSTIAEVVAYVESIFADDVASQGMVTLCTYHRSKGLEWQRVFLIEHTKRCPSPYARQAWQLRQEQNLAYVAITRAQATLAYVG